jgi:hypothetical protein
LVVLPFIRGVPLEKFEAEGESGRMSDVAGEGGAIAGRLSYDNIIGDETLGRLYIRRTASELKNVRHETESSQAEVKKKKWKEQTGSGERLLAFARNSDEQPGASTKMRQLRNSRCGGPMASFMGGRGRGE